MLLRGSGRDGERSGENPPPDSDPVNVKCYLTKAILSCQAPPNFHVGCRLIGRQSDPQPNRWMHDEALLINSLKQLSYSEG